MLSPAAWHAGETGPLSLKLTINHPEFHKGCGSVGRSLLGCSQKLRRDDFSDLQSTFRWGDC